MTLVLATVLLDPPSTMLFGCVFALISIPLIAKTGLPGVWKTASWSGVWALAYAFAVGVCYFNQPDWMFVYLLDTTKIPLVPVYVVFVIICVVFGVVGALATAVLVHVKRTALAIALTVGALLTLGATGLLTADQYVKLGTTQQYWAGQGLPLRENASMAMAMNISGAISALAGIPIVVLRVLRGRKAQPAA